MQALLCDARMQHVVCCIHFILAKAHSKWAFSYVCEVLKYLQLKSNPHYNISRKWLIQICFVISMIIFPSSINMCQAEHILWHLFCTQLLTVMYFMRSNCSHLFSLTTVWYPIYVRLILCWLNTLNVIYSVCENIYIVLQILVAHWFCWRTV